MRIRILLNKFMFLTLFVTEKKVAGYEDRVEKKPLFEGFQLERSSDAC